MKTWHIELLFIAIVLGAVAAIGGRWQDWVGSAAVFLSFAHAQVADRMAEYSAASAAPAHCTSWLDRYWVSKEALWLVYFVSSHAWPALAGCALFVAYPMWRRLWRRVHPCEVLS